MKHPQMYIDYYPKKENQHAWESVGVDLSSYISYQSNDSATKSSDKAEIVILLKDLLVANATYSSNVFTLTGVSMKTNQYRWFMVIDANDNIYRIESNTATTITLSTDYTFPGTPTSGTIRIRPPNMGIDDICNFFIWDIEDGVYTEPTADADKLVFVGQVTSISDKYDTSRGAQRIVKFNNFTEKILKYNMPAAYLTTGTFNTWVEIIQNILDRVAAANKNTVSITWDSSNPTTKSDGTPFPAISYYTDYKYAFEIIYTLCQDKYTGDGEYYFFVQPSSTNQYKFILRKKLLTNYTDLVEGEDFRLISRSIDAADAVNRLLIRCGKDPSGHNITTLVQATDLVGTRGKPVAHNFAGDIMTYEVQNSASGSFDTSASSDALYPLSYPYTTAYSVTADEAAKYSTKLSSGTYTAATKKDYRTWVRWLARAKAQIWGLEYMNHTSKYREKVKITYFNKPTSQIPGNLKRLKIPSIGWTGGSALGKDYRKILRTTERYIKLSKNGLDTSITYLQDWELT